MTHQIFWQNVTDTTDYEDPIGSIFGELINIVWLSVNQICPTIQQSTSTMLKLRFNITLVIVHTVTVWNSAILLKSNVVWTYFLVEIYSLTIQLQILGLGIKNFSTKSTY